MGHVRLGKLPATRKWNDVVALLARAPIEEVAGASADAAELSLRAGRDDPSLLQSFWLLTQLPLAARSGRFEEYLSSLEVQVSPQASLASVLGAISEHLDRHTAENGGRTDLGEIAQATLVQSVASTFWARTASTLRGEPRGRARRIGEVCGQGVLRTSRSRFPCEAHAQTPSATLSRAVPDTRQF